MILEVEKIKVDKLLEYENNAKIHTKKQIEKIKNSIQEFGFNDPIAIDENNMIIEGHGRLYALKELGYDEVDCIRLSHLTDQQKKAYILIHNKLTMETGFDLELLDNELLDITEIDMTEFGFHEIFDDKVQENEQKVNEILDGTTENEFNVKYGDIFLLGGKHKVMCGDSTVVENVKKLVGNKKVDLFLTDPPYNVAYTGKTKDALKIKNDDMDDDSFRLFLKNAFSTANSVMREGATFYIWHADLEGYNFRGACRDNDWKVRQCLIWKKNHMVIGRQDYHWQHEPCLYGWKEGASHFWNSDRKQTTILEFDKPQRNGEHPTMKPVDLFEYQIRNSSKKGDIILDLFGGSGTTIIACEQSDRIGYCIEYDPKYVNVILKRYQALTNNEIIKIEEGEDV